MSVEEGCRSNADCDDGAYCNGSEVCDPDATDANDEGCVDGELPCVGTTCNESTDQCTPNCEDLDGDGHGPIDCGGDDCDDDDGNRYPGNTEVCDIDSHDEDCDPRTFGIRDADGDDSPDAQCCNGDVCGDDCDDSRAGVHPSATEACDGRDNDCDSVVDEDASGIFYEDADGDDFGSNDPSAMTSMGCTAPAGFAENATDCDDAVAGINPGAPEVCDGLDNDCDEAIDEGQLQTCYADPDGDGYAAAGTPEVLRCACMSNETTLAPQNADSIDCVEGNPAVNPNASEVCDGLDSDCSEGGGAINAEDADGDGFTSISYGGCSGGPFPKTDCYDDPSGGAEINPAITGFRGDGYCPGGGISCNCGGSRVCLAVGVCPAAGSCSPVDGSPASFDYDCNGTIQPEPAFSGCGSDCSVCSSGGGPLDSYPVNTAPCGERVQWRTCRGGCPACSVIVDANDLRCR